jgi:hypothetical protein
MTQKEGTEFSETGAKVLAAILLFFSVPLSLGSLLAGGNALLSGNIFGVIGLFLGFLVGVFCLLLIKGIIGVGDTGNEIQAKDDSGNPKDGIDANKVETTSANSDGQTEE